MLLFVAARILDADLSTAQGAGSFFCCKCFIAFVLEHNNSLVRLSRVPLSLHVELTLHTAAPLLLSGLGFAEKK